MVSSRVCLRSVLAGISCSILNGYVRMTLCVRVKLVTHVSERNVVLFVSILVVHDSLLCLFNSAYKGVLSLLNV